MDIFQALILGVVEGITEFLPISSTGHLILTSRWLGLAQTDFLKSFQITIQLGAMAAVIFLYAKRLLRDFELWKKITVAFLPTLLVGFTLYQWIKQFLLGNEFVVLVSLFAGGVFLIVFERFYKEQKNAAPDSSAISYRQALWIGVFQSVSVIPGVSRSAATIIGGLVVGLQRKTIVEFSFLLALPTILAAAGYDVVKNIGLFSTDRLGLLAAGFVTAFLVAILCIRWLLRFIQTHNFTWFGIYRILIALSFWFFIR